MVPWHCGQHWKWAHPKKQIENIFSCQIWRWWRWWTIPCTFIEWLETWRSDYSITITVKPGQAFCPRIKIWFCCSKFESVLRLKLIKLKSKNGLLESTLDLNNQIWLEYRTIVVVSWTLEDVTKCVWPCLWTWKASLNLYSSAKVFSKAGIAKELRWQVLLLVRF